MLIWSILFVVFTALSREYQSPSPISKDTKTSQIPYRHFKCWYNWISWQILWLNKLCFACSNTDRLALVLLLVIAGLWILNQFQLPCIHTPTLSGPSAYALQINIWWSRSNLSCRQWVLWPSTSLLLIGLWKHPPHFNDYGFPNLFLDTQLPVVWWPFGIYGMIFLALVWPWSGTTHHVLSFPEPSMLQLFLDQVLLLKHRMLSTNTLPDISYYLVNAFIVCMAQLSLNTPFASPVFTWPPSPRITLDGITFVSSHLCEAPLAASSLGLSWFPLHCQGLGHQTCLSSVIPFP